MIGPKAKAKLTSREIEEEEEEEKVKGNHSGRMASVNEELLCVTQTSEGFFVVERRRIIQNQVAWLRRYRLVCREGDNGDDGDARARALHFGFLTEGFGRFRRFLGRNSSSGSDCAAFVCIRRNSRVSALRFAAVFVKVCDRAVSFRASSRSDDDDDEAVKKALKFLTGPAFGNWLSLQQCRSHEQGQALLQQQQITVMKINEEISSVPKSLKDNENVEDIDLSEDGCRNSINEGSLDCELVCSVCGCEDNEVFEKMIHPCSCRGGSIFVHPSCLSLDPSNSGTTSDCRDTNNCKFCGPMENPDGVTVKEEPSQVARSMLSFSTESANDCQPKGIRSDADGHFSSLQSLNDEIGKSSTGDSWKHDMTTFSGDKQGTSIPARRFDDSVTAVPIKKRKLSFAQFQSPSPPEASDEMNHSLTEPASELGLNFSESLDVKQEKCPLNLNDSTGSELVLKCVNSTDVKMNENASSVKSVIENVNLSGLNKPNHTSSDDNIPSQDPDGISVESPTIVDSAPICLKTDEDAFQSVKKESHISIESDCKRNDSSTSKTVLECIEQEDGDTGVMADSKGCELALGMKASVGTSSMASTKVLMKQDKGSLLRLNSGYITDDRSHWDLNAPMDSWEKQGVSTDIAGDAKISCMENQKKDLECSDAIKLDLLAMEADYKNEKSEQDMLSKGFQIDMVKNASDSATCSKAHRECELDTSLRLQRDSAPRLNLANIKNSMLTTNSGSDLADAMFENHLNLSICLAGECSKSSSSNDTPLKAQLTEELESVKDVPSVCNTHLETVLDEDKVVQCNQSDCSRESMDGIDNDETTESHNVSSSKTLDKVESEKECSLSSNDKDQHVETANDDDRNCDGSPKEEKHASPKEEKHGSPNASSSPHQEENSKVQVNELTAYGGDTEYCPSDEYEAMSESDKEPREERTSKRQGEQGEYKEEDQPWMEEDVAEELEDEHVDYGDSDFRDADDGMELDDKGKEIEDEKYWDEYQQSEVEEYMENQLIEHITQPEEVLDVRHAAERDSSIQMDAEDDSKQKYCSDDNAQAEKDEVSRDELSKDVANADTGGDMHSSKSKELKHSNSRSKSSGWDQLPEGYKNVEDALKAVQDVVGTRGRTQGWTPGGRTVQMSSRVSSSRKDSGYSEKIDSDDSFHNRDGIYRPGRDASLTNSPNFTSRKPVRGGRIAGRGGLSRGRSDFWPEGGRGPWNSSRRHSPEYYGDHAGYSHHASANAAVMSAAKVESSGFVVAMDGTLTKVSRGGIRGRRGRGSVMGRGSRIDLEDNMDFGSQMTMNRSSLVSDRARDIGICAERGNSGRHALRERFREPSFGEGRWDHPIDDSPPPPPPPPRRMMDHHLRERNRSFSPPMDRRLRHMPRSHTQSRSRSRTRSPRLRMSPRLGPGAGIARGPPLRRRSRSPPLRSEARSDRLRSTLFHNIGSFEQKMPFMSASRSRRSPPPQGGSRWSFERRDPAQFKGSEFRRSFRNGSPSRRMSPHRVHDSALDSPGRLKHENYRTTSYSRLEFSADRRLKRDEDGDGRLRQPDRLVRISSTEVRRYRRHDDEVDCEAPNSCAKDTGLSR